MINNLFAIDLDGTLLNAYKKISKPNLDALKHYSDNGGKIIIATGRSISSARVYVDMIQKYIGKKLEYIITLCGAIILDKNGKEIKKCLISNEISKKIYAKTRELKVACWAYNDQSIKKDSVLCNNKFFLFISKLNFPLKTIKFIPSSLNGIAKFNIFSFSKKKILKLVSWLSKELSDEINFSIGGAGRQIEIYNSKCSKGTSIQHVCSLLKIPLNQSAAIGDSGNDISAIKDVKFGFSIGGLNQLTKIAPFNLRKQNKAVKHAIENYLLVDSRSEAKMFAFNIDYIFNNLKHSKKCNFNKQLLNFVNRCNCIMCLCTDYSFTELVKISHDLGFSLNNFHYVVLENGTSVFDFFKNRLIAVDFLNKDDLSLVFNSINNHFKFALLNKKISVVVNGVKNEKIYSFNIEKFNDMHFDHLTNFLSISIYSSNKVLIDSIIKMLILSSASIGFFWVNNHHVIITNKNASKMNMLKLIISSLNISHNNLFGFGHYDNDLSILKLCSSSFAFSNASANVKKFATHIAPCSKKFELGDICNFFLKKQKNGN